ncbi:FAD-dependent monooxygenase [Umezawaea endophytica]|uniref:FAD-dependent monooxygenase n=1 Tax=Umezawaea endophytica TaxID=1654476 RepID=A0A9X2VUE8_9PSEU|nr:FAD-dependent monooxygenase [Umezawaea endophytica]MCS7482915.1 FAD-dependent monooxygenase [Umezawaea endophytica]
MATSVLISGASVAGPALAYWLDRFGFEVTVVEMAPALRQGGYVVDFRGPTHMTVLERMGIVNELRAHSTGGSPTRFVDGRGRSLLRLPAEFTGGELEIARSDLSEVLHRTTSDTVEYVFGDTITGLEQSPHGVDVTFEKAPARRFDLVIGADGMHSRVRGLAFGPEERFVSPLGYYLAGWDMPWDRDLGGEVLAHNRPGTAIALSASVRDPALANVLAIFASGPLPGTRGDRPRQHQVLQRVYGGQDWHVPAMLAALPRSADTYFDAIARVDVPSWSSGRVALLGDAACGATFGGMGTGTAIVAAYVLAGELERAGGDHAAAFDRYEHIVRPYATRCQEGGRSAAKLLAPGSRTTLFLRNRFLSSRVGGRLALREATKPAHGLTLPEYPSRTAYRH